MDRARAFSGVQWLCACGGEGELLEKSCRIPSASWDLSGIDFAVAGVEVGGSEHAGGPWPGPVVTGSIMSMIVGLDQPVGVGHR